MSVKVRKLKRGGFEVDIHVTQPDGKHHRERVSSPFPNSKALSREWGEQRFRKKYLVPLLGRKRLDEIKHEEIQKLKAKLVHLNPKTVNGILSVLTKLLKIAVEWQVIEVLPVNVKLLKATLPELPFYDFEDFERLVEGATKAGPEALAAVVPSTPCC